MDGLMDSLDCCNRAAKLAFENNIELEAECEAFTGKLFYKGLVNLSKAKMHLTNCIKLSLTLLPKDLSSQPWHQLATKHLQQVRDELNRKEQERIDAERKPYMDALKEDLEKITAESAKGCEKFLVFLNENYVPQEKKLNLTEDKLKENALKRTMVRLFIPIFHPDKNIDEDKKTQILREEICKHINGHVEHFKGRVD